jgi:hypothetical protein
MISSSRDETHNLSIFPYPHWSSKIDASINRVAGHHPLLDKNTLNILNILHHPWPTVNWDFDTQPVGSGWKVLTIQNW